MATWVTHFRIAERILETDSSFDRLSFLVGNIGPDCGLVGADGRPEPPKTITHFKTENGISSDLFKKTYLTDPERYTSAEWSYLVGYYFHLITDEYWVRLTRAKKEEPIVKAIVGTPDYTRLVKTDWYGIDFEYLAKHPNHIFWTDFRHITSFADVLPFFPQGQTKKQIQNITSFYETHPFDPQHTYMYMSPEEVDDFIEEVLCGLQAKIQEVQHIHI